MLARAARQRRPRRAGYVRRSLLLFGQGKNKQGGTSRKVLHLGPQLRRGADQIIVLNQGQVEEVGSHEELMGRPRLYSHLYAMNFAALREALPGNGVGH